MKNKSLTQKISLLALSLFSVGSLFGKTLAVDLKTKELDNSFKRPNTFILRSIQAGSTTDIDNIKITDLDTNEVVYENKFSHSGDATRRLVLHHYPDKGGVESNWNGRNWKDYVENGSMTRIVNEKLRLQTTGFNRNGSGGYNSVSDATYTGELPHNFMVEFEAQRLQWPGHFRMYAVYKNKGDTSANLAPSPDSFKGNQVKLAMYGEGGWYNTPYISITGKKSLSFAKPSGDPRRNTRYGMSINGTTVTFYMDGNSIGTANLSDYLKEEKPMNESDLTNGLVAWYPLDGNASDMSGNSRHGTIYGSNPTEDRHGKMNGAYNFDGKDDYIKINHDKAFNHLPLSISAWFKSNETTHGSIISKYWNASWNGWTVNVNSSSITPFYLRSFGKQIIGNHHPTYGENKEFGSTYESNLWNHVVLVYSNEGGELYLKGKLKDTKDWKGEAGSPSTSQPVNIGLYRRNNKGGDFFKGSIDDVRIYDRALSEEEVLALYELESTDPNDGRSTPPPLPGTGGLTPPDPDYKDTIAELKRLLAEKDKKLAHCEMEMAAKNKQIGNLTSENAKLQGEVKSLNGKVTGLEKQVVLLTTDNEGLKVQIKNLRKENQNISYELTVTNEHLEKAIHAAETPFINGWVYDHGLGWLFTDADHFPLVYTHKDETWHYYELGSSNPRYFFNYKTQEWVAWDPILRENEQVIVKK